MTLWNPLNVFSSSPRRAAGDDLSASFDPSWIGDPIGSDHCRPAIGFGDTRVGGQSGTNSPDRRPIGFAPPEVDADNVDSNRRYCTELSFKRHHEAPRASAIGRDDDGDAQESWVSPEPSFSADTPVQSDAVEEKVPFYKREIGFHRKRATSEETPGDFDPEVDETSEIAARADEEVEHDERDASDADSLVEADARDLGEVRALELLEDELEPESGEVIIEAVAEVDASSDVVVESLSPDASNEKVPFYKREITFRRKGVASDVEPTADVLAEPVHVATVDNTMDDHATDGDVENDEPVIAAQADESEERRDAIDEPSEAASPEVVAARETHDEDVVAEGDAESPTDVQLEVAVSDVAVASALGESPETEMPEVEMPEVEMPDADVPEVDPEIAADGNDLLFEDTPPSKGRLSRKERRAVAVPKRKPSRGGTKSRQVVGLKIGASQLSAAVISETEAGHELVDLARRPLEAGIVVDGEVRDVAALSRALKEFFEEENLPKKDVRIGLASNRIGVRTFDIAGIDDETRFDNAVRFKAHEVLPVAAHESVLDYRVIEERPNEAGEPTRRVLLVVASRDQVEPYVEVARQAGIKLSGIDLEALGLLRAFVAPKPLAARAVDDTATVIVSIGHESSTLLVAGGGACEFTRVFDWGGSVLVSAIATALEVQPAEAATILKHLSLSGPGRQYDGLDEITRAKALDAVRLRLTPFARELVNSLQFYQTQEESLGIAGIVITGGTSRLEGLGDVLYQMIGVNVSVGDPLGRVIGVGEYDAGIDAMMGSMAVSIGLAIDDVAMRTVNLLPTDAVKAKSRRSTLIAIGAPAAVAAN